MSRVVFSNKTRVSVVQRSSSVVSMMCVSGMQVGRPLTLRVKCVICCIYIRCKDRPFLTARNLDHLTGREGEAKQKRRS